MPDLEERSIEELPDRCENCGATLTRAEKQRILDEGASVALCTTCAAEQVPIAEEEGEADAAY
jgi:Early Protein (E6)